MGRVHHEPKPMVLTLLWNMSSCAILGCMTDNQTAETDEAVERVAAAAERASESFMERWRRRPVGDGDRMYEYADLLSTFASELRYPPGGES